MEKHLFNKTILREYDIRGIIEKDLHFYDSLYLGKSFATFVNNLKLKNIVIGYDGRKTSPKLEKHLFDGLISKGIKVYRIGLVPTPLLYYSMYKLKLDGGIMVTGSHNPPNYNGFKIVLRNKSIIGKDILNIAKISSEGKFSKDIKGIEVKKSMSNNYLNFLLKLIKIPEDIKVAWDPGNGAAGKIIYDLTKKINGNHYLINYKIDGNFPSHHPDPTIPKNLKQLIKLVKDKKCDVGFAFDGDGDRLGVVDNKGNIIWSDIVVAFLARDVLKKKPNAKIILDIKTSQVVFDEIKRLKGIPILWKTGHSLIKKKMKEIKSVFAGEMSGHIFFGDSYYGFDDAIYASIRFLNLYSKIGQPLSEILNKIPKSYTTPELRFPTSEKEKFIIIDKLRYKLKKEKKNYIGIDGVRYVTKDGWWLVRASNTQNIIVGRCESFNKKDLRKIKENLKKNLNDCGFTIKKF